MADPLVVYTDLDGTLLDHHTYDWAPAAPMLRRLEALAIPVVIVTSKTRAEVAALREDLGNPHPFIVENGAVTVIPPGYFAGVPASPGGADAAAPRQGAREAAKRTLLVEVTREEIQRVVAELRAALGVRCSTFDELGVCGIIEHTGLDAARARLANAREGSEPLLWQDTAARLDAFRAALADRGLRCVQGGRFVHVLGQVDKADAVRRLHRRFEAQRGAALLRVVLGDGPNDAGMLREADVAVIVRGEHGHSLALDTAARVIRTQAPGPDGWSQAMAQVLASTGHATQSQGTGS